jgi:hypothetical protein
MGVINLSADSNFRWWEFYLVRYFVGTVCGTIIILFLVFLPESEVHKLIENKKILNQTIPSWEPIHLWIYGLIGLAYCYIASGPILFLHAIRGWFARKKIFNYYTKLSINRSARSSDEATREYVESYKHLREHGNAFFIVLLELIFGFMLYKFNGVGMLILIAVWVSVSASVWVIGTRLEIKFANL